MLVKCQKCGHENQLGSIFCRECGEKLDLNAIDPEKIEKSKGGKGKTVRRVVSIIVFLVVIGCAALMFLPVAPCPEVNAGIAESATDKLEYCIADKMSIKFKHLVAKLGEKDEIKFSCNDLNYLFNKRFFGNESISAGNNFEIESINFAPAGDNLKVTLYTKLAGKAPVAFTLVGSIEKSSDAANPVEFKVKSAKVGRLPVCRKCSKVVIDKFQPVLQASPEISKAFKKASEVEVDDGELVFKFSK